MCVIAAFEKTRSGPDTSLLITFKQLSERKPSHVDSNIQFIIKTTTNSSVFRYNFPPSYVVFNVSLKKEVDTLYFQYCIHCSLSEVQQLHAKTAKASSLSIFHLTLTNYCNQTPYLGGT